MDNSGCKEVTVCVLGKGVVSRSPQLVGTGIQTRNSLNKCRSEAAGANFYNRRSTHVKIRARSSLASGCHHGCSLIERRQCYALVKNTMRCKTGRGGSCVCRRAGRVVSKRALRKTSPYYLVFNTERIKGRIAEPHHGGLGR